MMKQVKEFPTLDELMRGVVDREILCDMLIQALAMLSVTPKFATSTPDDIFEAVYRQVIDVRNVFERGSTEKNR